MIRVWPGNLTAQDYEDTVANDPRVDALREKMNCVEKPEYTKDYLDPDKRSIANAVQIFYKDGSSSEQVAVEYPIGYRRRRSEGIPELIKKFKINLQREFDDTRAEKIMNLNLDIDLLQKTPVNEYVDLYTK